MSFSERYGFVVPRTIIQKDSMDNALRIGLWNIVYKFISEPLQKGYSTTSSDLYPLIHHYYFEFLKKEIDKIPYTTQLVATELKEEFMSWKWYRVYDFIEFVLQVPNPPIHKAHFKTACNHILERELSGWRIVDYLITPITNEEEISSVQEALSKNGTKFKLAAVHLNAALVKLSDKTDPDYRNSIKESISAVENVCKIISGKQSDTLNSAIDKIKGNLSLHRSFEKGVKEMYNYTSDSGGIRHAMKDDITPDFDDAKYMLVTCSAFTNYLIAKAEKAGLI